MKTTKRINKLLIPLIIAIVVALASIVFAFVAKYSETCHRMFTDAEFTVHIETNDREYTVIIEQDHDYHGEKAISIYYKDSLFSKKTIGHLGDEELSGFDLENGKFYVEYGDSTLTFFYCIGDVAVEENWKNKTFEFEID